MNPERFKGYHTGVDIEAGEKVQLAGYVQNEADLSAWLDPVLFFEERL